MQTITVYCERCKRSYSYDLILEEEKPKQETGIPRPSTQPQAQTLGGIPIPIPTQQVVADSGLKTYSVSHGDHVLVMEIDKNGAVRKTEILETIKTETQKILTVATLRIFDRAMKLQRPHRVLVVTEDPLWRIVMSNIVSMIMTHKKKHDPVLMTYQDDGKNMSITINNLSIEMTSEKKKAMKKDYEDKIIDITRDIFEYHNTKEFLNKMINAKNTVAVIYNKNYMKVRHNPEEIDQILPEFINMFYEKAKADHYFTHESGNHINVVSILTIVMDFVPT